MIHRKILSSNGTVHYWIERNENPNAKSIVFTHGLAANHSMFEKQVDFLSSKYTTITWDVPLHGLSAPYSNFSYKQTAIELRRILKEEHISKVILVGMSMGGYCSQLFIEMFPEMVEGFIALDTTPLGREYYPRLDLWLIKQVEILSKGIPLNILKKLMAKAACEETCSYNKMMEMLNPLTKSQLIEMITAVYTSFVTENQNILIPCPVLILLGDKDNVARLKQYCYKWSEVTGYPLHIIRDASHFSNWDNSQQVNNEISAFIKSLQ